MRYYTEGKIILNQNKNSCHNKGLKGFDMCLWYTWLLFPLSKLEINGKYKTLNIHSYTPGAITHMLHLLFHKEYQYINLKIIRFNMHFTFYAVKRTRFILLLSNIQITLSIFYHKLLCTTLFYYYLFFDKL